MGNGQGVPQPDWGPLTSLTIPIHTLAPFRPRVRGGDKTQPEFERTLGLC